MPLRLQVPSLVDRVYPLGPPPLLRWRIVPGELPRGRPLLRVEHAPGRHLRVVSGPRVLLWARVKSFWEGVWLLAASCPERPPLPVPPITTAEVRAVTHRAGSQAWRTVWARHFARALEASLATILHPGDWELATEERGLRDARRSSAAADGVLEVQGARASIFESWTLNGSNAILPLRPLSADGSARVKALRKLARDGTLPPLLTWFISGLDMHLLLDGHDRLAAARIEGVPITRIAVSATHEMRWQPDPKTQEGELRRANVTLEKAADNPLGLRASVVDAVNRVVANAFAEGRSTYPRTRAFPLPGGPMQWRREVEARLRELGAPADDPMIELA